MSDEIRLSPRNDGTEEENSCARCGSTVTFQHCEQCGGQGTVEVADWEGGMWEDAYRCDVCTGSGGWWICLSDAEWCNAHPIAGREAIPRGAVEWFAVSPSGRSTRQEIQE